MISKLSLNSFLIGLNRSGSDGLVVTRIRRVTVSVGTGIVLVAREESTTVRLFGVGTEFDVLGCRVAGENIVGVGGAIRVVLVAAPEETTTTTGAVGIVVVRGRTEPLLALVVVTIEGLQADGDEEEGTVAVSISKVVTDVGAGENLHPNNGYCKNNLLQLTGHTEAQLSRRIIIAIPRPQRCIDLSLTTLRTITGQHRDGNHGSNEEHIK